MSSRSHNAVDLVGKEWGCYTVISYQGVRGKISQWLCRCSCGNESVKVINEFYRQGPKNCRKCFKGSWKGVGKVPHSYWTTLLSSARKRNIPVTVTIEQISQLFEEQKGRCTLSGIELTFTEKRVRGTASLDRIKSDKPYELDNLQWIHKDLNKFKGPADHDDFLDWCHIVSEYQNTLRANY